MIVSQPAETNPGGKGWQPTWHLILAGVYLIGLLVALLRLGAGLLKISALRRQTHILAESPEVNRWLHELGIKRPVDVGISNVVRTPALVGFWRPLIVIPGHLYAQCDHVKLDRIIVHELAHVKRWDSAANLLGHIATTVYWFHPLIYLAQRALQKVREEVCDDWVLATVGDAKGYASTLLEVKAGAQSAFAASLRLDMARASNITERIERITRPGKWTSPRLNWLAAGPATAIVLGLGVLLGCAHFGHANTATPTEQTDQRFGINQGGKHGFIDGSGQVVIEPRFEMIGSFAEGLSAVRFEGKWGFIDKSGAFVVEPRFEKVTYGFTEGLCAVRLEGKWGFIDKSGAFAVESLFERVRHFSEGLAAVKKGNKWGYVDREGKIVIEPQFDKGAEFKNGLAHTVRNDGFKGYIDRSGSFVWGASLPSYDDLPFYFGAEELKKIVTNPAGTNAERFVAFDVELGLAGKTEKGTMTAGEIGGNAIVQERINAYVPRIKSIIVTILRSKTIDQLTAGEAFKDVQTEIETGLNQEIFQKLFRMNDDKMEILVQEVNFSQLIIQ